MKQAEVRGVCPSSVSAAREVLQEAELRHLVDRAGPRGPREIRELYSALGARGLLGPQIPQQYGGDGESRETGTAIYEELVHAGVPDTPYVLTVQIVAELLLRFASEALRQRYLPGICAGRTLACVLYTEPGAGSDLGGLRATATPDGDHFVLSGTKVYSLYSDVADVALVAARIGEIATNRYAGITLFAMDLDSPGVSVEVMPSVQDEKFCRVRFRNVKLPASAVVGEPGQGWELLEDALAIERTGIDHAARAVAWLKPLAADLMDASSDDERFPVLGRLAMRTDVALALSRSVCRAAGESSVAVVATAKCVASQIAGDVGIETFLRVAPGRDDEVDRGSAAREAPGLTLSAGTTEMMRELFLAQLRHGDLDALDVAASALDRSVYDAAAGCVGSVMHGRRRPIPDRLPDSGRAAALWGALCAAQLPQLELPPDLGGFGLGPVVGVTICEVLGAHGVEDAYSPGAAALASLAATDSRVVGLRTGALLSSWGSSSIGGGRNIHVGAWDDASEEVGALGPPAHLSGPTLDRARLHSTAYLLGAGMSVLGQAFSHARERSQFDTRLIDRQAVSHPLVAEAMQLVALRHYLHETVSAWSTDTASESVTVHGLHLLALDSVVSSARRAVQAVGTAGLTGASDVGGMYARILAEVRCWATRDDPWRRIGRVAAASVGDAFDWFRPGSVVGEHDQGRGAGVPGAAPTRVRPER